MLDMGLLIRGPIAVRPTPATLVWLHFAEPSHTGEAELHSRSHRPRRTARGRPHDCSEGFEPGRLAAFSQERPDFARPHSHGCRLVRENLGAPSAVR